MRPADRCFLYPKLPHSTTPRSFAGRRLQSSAAAVALAQAMALPTAHALQMLDVRDGVAIEAIVSLKEPTRIRIEGAAITDVFGNIHSTGCSSTSAGTAALVAAPAAAPPVNPSGEFVLECDRDKGEIYIRPVGEGTKPINLFVSSARATYTLILRRSDTPADTIVLRDRTQRSGLETDPSSGAPGYQHQGPLSTAPAHVRALKSLLLGMSSHRQQSGLQVEEIGRPVQLWREASMTLLQRYEGRALIGEKYLLQNVSNSEMVLAEQEFDRPDSRDAGQVLAVAIEHHNLSPGATTRVYVIRRGGL